MSKYETHLKAEHDRLSLPLRCCWALRSWDKTVQPSNVKEWASIIGWRMYEGNYKIGSISADRERYLEIMQAENIAYQLIEHVERNMEFLTSMIEIHRRN